MQFSLSSLSTISTTAPPVVVVCNSASFGLKESIVGFNTSATPGIANTLSNSWLIAGICALTILAITAR
jgi:hypothetical protein